MIRRPIAAAPPIKEMLTLKLSLPDSATTTGRMSRIAIAVVAGGGLALGVAGLAHADPSPDPSASAPSASAPAETPAQREHKPHLAGTVTSIDGGKILIKDRDGFTRQINIATVPADVKVGVRVHAEGTVNADGVSLDATAVTLAPDRPEGMRGPWGHGGRGEGGPGKHGRPGPGGAPSENGTPPAPSESGAPSAPAPSATS
ncbi:hypothetical protein JIG36_35595 [Actinoplanes sp. LDG1-06]|uniref:DUF5666 domain-containing protein n=1 Tax=Paractinoplanes ovalisporus TaxID=2810368 RepID=A0ABS2AM39_9ACTN|nr:hypothetical protein [Actinoplanes ovalisporus]MBM2620838.1 hypothetical protein [Actinoplanes ovalisporus]